MNRKHQMRSLGSKEAGPVSGFTGWGVGRLALVMLGAATMAFGAGGGSGGGQGGGRRMGPSPNFPNPPARMDQHSVSTAQPVKPQKGRPADVNDAEMVALEQFLSLSDEQLELIERAVARIRAMSPAEREAFRREILAYRKLPPDQRMQLRQGWGRVNPQARDDWREMMLSLPESQVEAMHRKMETMTPAERLAYRERVLKSYREERAKRRAMPPSK